MFFVRLSGSQETKTHDLILKLNISLLSQIPHSTRNGEESTLIDQKVFELNKLAQLLVVFSFVFNISPSAQTLSEWKV